MTADGEGRETDELCSEFSGAAIFLSCDYQGQRDISIKYMDGPVRDAETHKLGRKGNVAETRNRFDDLPESILLHILSFLPTECAVGASLVSKFWNNLWLSVPNLSFEERSKDELRRAKFLNFVNKVLQLQSSRKVNKFSLSFDVDGNSRQVSTWIDYAVSHGVQELKLGLYCCLCYYYNMSLPVSLFTCESLTKMELEMTGALMLPPKIHFSNLKFLRLSHLSFQNGHLTNQLFSNSPLLEGLELSGCNWSFLKSVHISAPRLTSLAIFEASYICSNCQVFIHGARLKSFCFGGPCSNEYSFVNSSSLLDARINVRYFYKKEGGNQGKGARRAHKLLEGLYDVRLLTITYETLQILNSKEDLFCQTPMFGNLTHLRVTKNPLELTRTPVDILCGGLLNLLRKSPSLYRLEALEGMILGLPNGKDDLGWYPIPECFLTSLKIITLAKFHGKAQEYAGIKVLLMVAGVLEKLCLKFIGGKKAKKEFFRQLGMLPKETIERIFIS